VIGVQGTVPFQVQVTENRFPVQPSPELIQARDPNRGDVIIGNDDEFYILEKIILIKKQFIKIGYFGFNLL
jgi:signal peptidase I